MEFQYYGANCVRLVTKKAAVTIDDNLAQLGLKSVTKAGDVVLFTGAYESPAVETKLIIDGPGEYEVADLSITGVGARAHIDEKGLANTMYRIEAEDLRVVVLGHIDATLSESQLESLGITDVLIVPVGGSGYTLDAVGAAKVIKEIEPKIVIPTHYADKAINYEVPQSTLDEALKVIAIEPKDTAAKVKIKPIDLTDNTQVIVLERQ